MPKEPLVSAVIITYNQEKYIEQTIDCALAQKVDFPYEIIIGEDCSTDKTREICLRYQAKYPDIIRVITSDKNVGLLDNWYRSVKAARGEYIAGCAGDDYWHNPEKLQKQVEFLENNQEYGIVHSDSNILYEDKGIVVSQYNQTNGIKIENKVDNTLEALFLGRHNMTACTTMFRKKMFDKYYNIEELKNNNIIMEDIPLWFEITAHSKSHYMNESFLTHREMIGTISNPACIEKKIMLWESCYQCYLYYYKKYKNKLQGVDEKIIHRQFNGMLLRFSFDRKRSDLVRQYYLNIKNRAGLKNIKLGDKVRYYSTYIPYGMTILGLCLKRNK